MSDSIPVFPTPGPMVRLVPVDRPWDWLAKGWRDFLGAPQVSLAYGGVLVAISVAITLALYLADEMFLLLPMAAGFMFVAPALAVGLYETSRRLAAGQPVTLADAMGAWRRNGSQIATLGLLLMLIHLFWIRIAMLLFPLFFTGNYPPLPDLLDMFLRPSSLPFLVTGTVIGAGLAAITFMVAAISIPMLLDRDVSVFTAIATSVTAVRRNPWPMALWAAIIVVITVGGLVIFYLGLAVALPLIAHASWHCYRDLVE